MLESIPAFDYRGEAFPARTQSVSGPRDLSFRGERTRDLMETETVDVIAHEELEITSTPRWGKNEECFCDSGESFGRCHGTAIYGRGV